MLVGAPGVYAIAYTVVFDNGVTGAASFGATTFVGSPMFGQTSTVSLTGTGAPATVTVSNTALLSLSPSTPLYFELFDVTGTVQLLSDPAISPITFTLFQVA